MLPSGHLAIWRPIMIDVVLRTIRRHEMLPPGGRVLCALSGGADSVALLHILLELQARGELAVAGVAHFNHRSARRRG